MANDHDHDDDLPAPPPARPALRPAMAAQPVTAVGRRPAIDVGRAAADRSDAGFGDGSVFDDAPTRTKPRAPPSSPSSSSNTSSSNTPSASQRPTTSLDPALPPTRASTKTSAASLDPPVPAPTTTPRRPTTSLDPALPPTRASTKTSAASLEPPVPAPTTPPQRATTSLDPALPPLRGSTKTSAASLDPPVPAPTTPPRRPTTSLDPALPPQRGSTKASAASLDPPVPAPTTPPRRSTTSLDPALPPAGIVEVSGERPVRRRASLRQTLTVGAGVAAAGVFVLAVVAKLTTGGGADRDRLTFDEERAATAAWRKEGLQRMGEARVDAVTAAVEANIVGVGRAIGEALGGRAGRVIVVEVKDRGDMLGLPDGTVVVTTGLLAKLNSEAELASLAAHALAHVALGHTAAALAPAVPTIRSATLAGTSSVVDGTMTPLLRAPFSAAQEAEVDAVVQRAMYASGWDASQYAAALKTATTTATPWAQQHGVDDARVRARSGVEASGRAGDADYRSRVLAPLGALPPPPPPPPPPVDAAEDEEDEDEDAHRPATPGQRHPSSGRSSSAHPR